jgi:hypothetical protein
MQLIVVGETGTSTSNAHTQTLSSMNAMLLKPSPKCIQHVLNLSFYLILSALPRSLLGSKVGRAILFLAVLYWALEKVRSDLIKASMVQSPQ